MIKSTSKDPSLKSGRVCCQLVSDLALYLIDWFLHKRAICGAALILRAGLGLGLGRVRCFLNEQGPIGQRRVKFDGS